MNREILEAFDLTEAEYAEHRMMTAYEYGKAWNEYCWELLCEYYLKPILEDGEECQS